VPRNYAVVRANKYEKRRAHIVVYNWNYWTKRTTKVGVSLANAGLKPGDKITIFDVQTFNDDPAAAAPSHFGNAVWTGTYFPGMVAKLDLGLLTHATPPIGLRHECAGDTSAVSRLPHTAPLFGAFLVVATPPGVPNHPAAAQWTTDPPEHALVRQPPSALPCPDPHQACARDPNAIVE